MAKKKVEELDEIVFRDRNKEYGAYYLRKVYNKFTTRSLLFSLTIMLLVVLIPFLIFQQSRSLNVDKSVAAEFTTLTTPPDEAPPPPPPPPEEQQVVEKARFTAPIVTTDTVDQGQTFNQDELNIQSTTVQLDTNVNIVVEEKKDEVIEQPELQVFTIVEEFPKFPGGDEAGFAFLSENIKYPVVARDNGIQGTVYVEFTVNTDGSIVDVTRKLGTKEVGAGCDEEAIRVVKMMPKWSPGKQSGKNVRVRMVLPVKFKLQDQ